jgi:hypothetical protein
MPIRISGFSIAVALACGALLALAAGASAKSVIAELRVLTPTAVLEPGTSYVTNTGKIKTDPGADCFGAGTGGSGATVAVPGPTPLGAVRSALRTNRALRPISISDHFGFGLAICGFGGHSAASDFSTFWYLKVNHREPTTGGDQTRLHNGDQVLWFLAPSNYPNPNPAELELQAPARAKPGLAQVTVLQHACDTSFPSVCSATPAVGAVVGGVTTDSAGHASVSLSQTTTLVAARGGSIPSNLAKVCVNADLGQCPRFAGKRIIGSVNGDRIRGSKGPDLIQGRQGNDKIRVRGRSADRVNCGGGRHDVVTVDKADKVSNCEVVHG